MPTAFYDVVVLGTRLTPLLTAALLSGRGLRVLVLGQGVPQPTYRVGTTIVPRDAFPILGVQSASVQRVVEELTLKQDFRQHLSRAPGPFQLVLREHRIDLHHNASDLEAELAREMLDVRQQAMDIQRSLAEVRDELDAFVARDLQWPPETFLERQRFSLAAAALPFDRHGDGLRSWEQLSTESSLRRAFEGCLPLLSGLLADRHSDATRARLYAEILSDVTTMDGGFAWLQQALVSRIRTWGGDVRAADRAERVRPERRRGHLVRLGRSDEEIGCAQLVHGTPISELSQILDERGALGPLFERVGEPRTRGYRCSVHALVARAGIPDALAPLGLVQGARDDLFFLLECRASNDQEVLVTITRLVEEHLVDTGSSPLAFVREEALAALRSVIPFIDDHLVWLDSPHDGIGPTNWRGPTELPCSDPWSRGPHTMLPVYEYPTTRALGVCALPTRSPVPGILIGNAQVAPGMGFEGAFLVAATIARTIGASYRRQDWLRRGPWGRRSV